MRAVRFIAVAIASLSVASPARAESWEGYLARVRALPEQFRLEQEISLEELAAGVRRGEWTEQEAAEAKVWLQRVLPPVPQRVSSGETLFSTSSFASLARRVAEGGASRAVATLSSTLEPRCRALFREHWNSSQGLLITANRLAAEIWAEAKNPQQLQPAVHLVDETSLEFKEAILTPRIPSPPRPPQIPQFRSAFQEFKHTYAIIHPDPPFLFPDPAADPAGFRAMWRYYLALRAIEQQGFVSHRAVSRRITALGSQYEAVAKKAWEDLQKSAFENAPAENVAAAVNRVAQLPPLPSASRAYLPLFFPLSPSREPAAAPDYRLITRQWLAKNPDRADGSHAYKLQPYRDWLAFRQAEEARDRGAMSRQREKLRQNLRDFPPALAARVGERLAARSAPEPLIEKASAVQTLSRRLTQDAAEPGEGSAIFLQALAKQWASLAGPAAEWRGSPSDSIGAWVHLAAREERGEWFDLRDKALRELFAKWETAPAARLADNVPFAAQLRAFLENALELGDTESAARLLAIDSASALLGLPERAAYLQSVAQLASARVHLESGRVAEARQAFRGVLAGAASPATAHFVVGELKRLSKTTRP